MHCLGLLVCIAVIKLLPALTHWWDALPSELVTASLIALGGGFGGCGVCVVGWEGGGGTV